MINPPQVPSLIDRVLDIPVGERNLSSTSKHPKTKNHGYGWGSILNRFYITSVNHQSLKKHPNLKMIFSFVKFCHIKYLLIAKSPEISFSLSSWQMFVFQTKRRSWHCCKQYSAQRNSWTQPSLKHQVLLSHFCSHFALLKALWYCVVCLSLSIANKNSILCLLLGDGWAVCHNITPGTQETSEKSEILVCIILASGCANSQHVFRFFKTWNLIQTSKNSVTSPKCLVNTSGLLTPPSWKVKWAKRKVSSPGQLMLTVGRGGLSGGRYLKWRVYSTFIYKAVLGGGFPLHKPDVYSFYRWGFFNF